MEAIRQAIPLLQDPAVEEWWTIWRKHGYVVWLNKLKQIVLIFFQLLNDLRCHNQAKPETCLSQRTPSVSRAEIIESRNYRMPIYRDFQSIEEYIVTNLQYQVSSILKFCLPNILRKFPEISENSLKIPKITKIPQKFWKFAENSSKRRSF